MDGFLDLSCVAPVRRVSMTLRRLNCDTNSHGMHVREAPESINAVYCLVFLPDEIVIRHAGAGGANEQLYPIER